MTKHQLFGRGLYKRTIEPKRWNWKLMLFVLSLERCSLQNTFFRNCWNDIHWPLELIGCCFLILGRDKVMTSNQFPRNQDHWQLFSAIGRDKKLSVSSFDPESFHNRWGFSLCQDINNWKTFRNSKEQDLFYNMNFLKAVVFFRFDKWKKKRDNCENPENPEKVPDLNRNQPGFLFWAVYHVLLMPFPVSLEYEMSIIFVGDYSSGFFSEQRSNRFL